ncbi:hypothetical protein ANCCAN_12953, partial [Ancylostoma caninum]
LHIQYVLYAQYLYYLDILQEYDCDLEKIAKDYLDDPAYLLDSQYGLIKGVGRRGSTIDQQLDEAFKSLEWGMLKEVRLCLLRNGSKQQYKRIQKAF